MNRNIHPDDHGNIMNQLQAATEAAADAADAADIATDEAKKISATVAENTNRLMISQAFQFVLIAGMIILIIYMVKKI